MNTLNQLEEILASLELTLTSEDPPYPCKELNRNDAIIKGVIDKLKMVIESIKLQDDMIQFLSKEMAGEYPPGYTLDFITKNLKHN